MRPGIERRQGAELFGHHDGRMVGQHDAARADPDGLGAGRDMGHHHGGGGARHAGGVVMLHQPVAVIAQAFGMPGQIQRLAEGGGDAAALLDGREIKNGKRDHGGNLEQVRPSRLLLEPIGDETVGLAGAEASGAARRDQHILPAVRAQIGHRRGMAAGGKLHFPQYLAAWLRRRRGNICPGWRR